MKDPDFSLAKASLGCAQVHVENHFPVAAGMQLMGGGRPHHDLISHWAPGILPSQLNICLRAGQKVAQKLLLRVNNSLSKLLASALCGGNRGFTVSYEFNI